MEANEQTTVTKNLSLHLKEKLPDASISRWHCYLTCSKNQKEMEPHSSILAWRIPWTGEPSALQSMGSGSGRVGHDLVAEHKSQQDTSCHSKLG